MLNYETAVKLKNAGFPQNKSDFYYSKYAQGTNLPVLESKYDDTACGEFLCDTPTLSELIEACGDNFHCLVYTTNGGMDCDRKFWSAGKNALAKEWSNGSTPEEAVANLWLALNCKCDGAKAQFDKGVPMCIACGKKK